MSNKVESKVGSKGELFPPKHIRKKLGLEPGKKISYIIDNGRLIVEPIPDLRSLLKQKPKVRVALEELKNERSSLSRAAEK